MLIRAGRLTKMPTINEEEDIDHTIAVIMGLDVVLLTTEENSQSSSGSCTSTRNGLIGGRRAG